MFKAIGKYFRALGYLITGNIDEARKALETSPYTIAAKFDAVIGGKKVSIQQYMSAVAGLVAQSERKKATLEQLKSDVERLETLKTGAAAKAKQRITELQGKSEEEIKNDAEYKQCLAAFNDFSSTLEEKQTRIAELGEDIRNLDVTIGNHKVQLQELQRNIEKLKEEKHETIADVITAREEKELADMISNISQDDSAQDLAELRDLRAGVKAEAKVSSELAGTDTKAQEAQFLEFARKSASNTEFEQLVGLAKKADSTASESVQADQGERVPE